MKYEELSKIWIAVKVERGFPAKARAFSLEKPALQQERMWRDTMNPDYDDTEVFEVPIENVLTNGL